MSVIGRIAAILLALTSVANAGRVEIKNGQFYVDGEPFYVVGIGYSSLRPHQRPGVSYAQTNKRWIEMDFKRIKAAHFNTIRTWDDLTSEELALAKKHGLMVLQGIWLDPRQDFSEPHNQDSCVARVETIAQQSKDFDNILGYLVMTEPTPEAVIDSGEEETLRFFRRLKRSIQAIDPRPVSMDSWLPLSFLDHSIWDFVTFNTFAFSPRSVNHALGFAGYNRWLVERHAPDKPFIVGETGGYSVSKASTSAYGGFGGLNEYDQSLKNIESLRGTNEGHASGAVLVSWIDSWHYPKPSETHIDEPWAWNGIVGIPTDAKKDMDGIPRQAYRDVMTYNQAILIEPKANHYYKVGESLPMRVYTSENVGGVDYSLNGAEWRAMQGSGHGWWRGFFQLPKTARRRQRLTIRGLDPIGNELVRKETTFLAFVPTDAAFTAGQPASTKKLIGASPDHLSIGLLDASKKTGLLSCTVRVLDDKQRPAANRKVYFGFFFPNSWRESQGTFTTNAQGEVTLTCPIVPQSSTDRFLFVAAGTDNPDQVRTGDMRLFKLGS